MMRATVDRALSGAARLAAGAPRALWLTLGAIALLAGVYGVGRWQGKTAGKLEARHQVVQDSLEHNAKELGVAAVHLDSAQRKAAKAGEASDSARGQYRKARKRVVVVNDSTVIDESIGATLTAPAVVEFVRSADSLKVKDSLTIVAVTGRAVAAEASIALLTTRVGLLEEENALLREEHAPLLGRAAGVGLAIVGVGLGLIALLH